MLRPVVRALLVAALLASTSAAAQPVLKIGSKSFTESYILGEILLKTALKAGPAVHKAGLGNTGILYAALRTGSIDLYPEYSGTIAREILRIGGNPTIAELNHALAPLGLHASIPFGFSNGYVLGVREALAKRLKLKKISDLTAYPKLRFGFSQEFLARPDGWPGLRAAYGLPQKPVSLDHGLAYQALSSRSVDVIDAYATDAALERYRVRTLVDDRGFFPRYDALVLYRSDVPHRFPKQWRALQRLKDTISESKMRRMNAAAELGGQSFAQAAGAASHTHNVRARRTFLGALFASDLARLTEQHLLLVFGSLAASVVIGIPLGVVAVKSPATAQFVFAIVGLFQTVPSLALLAFLIALTGTIGTVPALLALFLYALLPIVRNTHAGLVSVGAGIVQAAQSLGLSPADRLWAIELPLARRLILAGVKTSAVINVGTATLAAFIGAGGYGDRIVAGLAVNDPTLMLAGAVPAAVLALAIQGLFELLERFAAAPV